MIRRLFRLGVGPCVAVGLAASGSVACAPQEARQVSADRPVFCASLLTFLSTDRVLSYPYDQVWPTSVRYLRVDRGYEITDRDREAGYVMFTYTIEGNRSGQGSLEMFETKDPSGRPSTKMSVDVSGGPAHLSFSIADGLARKLREERGQPAPPPPPDQDPPADDPGKDGGDGVDRNDGDDGDDDTGLGGPGQDIVPLQ